jgi:hypothetical protein
MRLKRLKSIVKFDNLIKLALPSRRQGPRSSTQGEIIMPVKASMSGLDYSKEGTTLGFWMIDLTAANFDAQVANFTTLRSAIQGVTLIDFLGAEYPGVQDNRENQPAGTPAAQREIKWRVKLLDIVTQKFSSFEIGGADMSLLQTNSDLMDLTQGAGQTLANTIEAQIVSEVGNTVSVQEVRLVGRAL